MSTSILRPARRRRRGRRRRLRRDGGRILTSVVGLVSALPLVAMPPGADPGPPSAPDRIAAAAASTEDRSRQMPRTRRNEVTGEFFGGRGYDLRAVVEDGNLNIYDRDSSGGDLLRSTPTDLYEPTTDNDFRDIFGQQGDWARDNGLGAIALTYLPQELAFYMAGLKRDGDDFVHVLYKLPGTGSCAQLSCAEWVTTLPTSGPNDSDLVITTALAAGTIGTRSFLAVGLTTANGSLATPGGPPMDGGILLVDASEEGSVISTYQDDFPTFPTSPTQTAVTALDWDDNGSGLLAVGAASEDRRRNLHAVRVSADGTFSNGTNWTDPSVTSPLPLSVAVGHRADGSPVLAYGMSDGGVKLWDPAVTSSTLLAQFTGPGDADAVDALTFTDRIDGTVGVPDLVAVSHRGDSARVLRYSGATTLTPLAVAPQNGTSTDVGGIRAWFPGYKTGSILFFNSDKESDVQLDFATRPNASYGCWFSQGFDRAPPPLPTTSVTVERNAYGPVGPGVIGHTVAALTAGERGDCAATDFTGQWAAYVAVTPLGRPADRTVAKLVWSRSGQLTVQSVGGPLTFQLEQTNDSALGGWVITIQSPPPPGAPVSTGLRVTGNRLDPAGTTRPVYRFDVAATTWPLPASTPPRGQAVLPPLRVRGTTAAGADVDLGLLVPQGQPSRATSGSVTLSPVSFYWQNPATGQQITRVWVDVGPGTPSSNVVDVPSLAVPPAGTDVYQLVVCPSTSSAGCDTDADPVANGLDQTPLRIQVYDTETDILPVTDPLYGRIYYRDEDGELLTGLVPADGSPYIRVSPYAGAYPNNGSSTPPPRPPVNAPVGGRFGYLSTTTTAGQGITAHVGGSEEASALINVDAVDLTPQVQAGAQAGPGFYLTGCTGDYRGTDFCRLAQITATAPGLFLTSDPDTGELRLGLQLQTQAQTSLTSLPLQQLAGQPEHTVVAQTLLVNNGEVHLKTTSGFQPDDAVDTWLVTHGTQIPVSAVRVGGGN